MGTIANGGNISVNIANASETSLASPFAFARKKKLHANIIKIVQIKTIVDNPI